ncbi:MAG: GldG family protein, partial [Bdellovibrionales bacterium]|nr:GldG family protein [Bdellovibrionales bacterium]
MSRIGLVSLLVAGISFLIMLVTRFLLGHWMDILWAPLATGVAGLIGLLALESRTILEFLTMRTTKNGMNMGVIIALALVMLGSINFLSVRYDKSFDFTEEKINSLADQTTSVLDSLDEDMTFLVFYKGEEAAAEKNRMKVNLEMYGKYSNRVKVRFYNTYKENLRAQQYLNPLPDKDSGSMFVFAEYKGKRIRVDNPIFSEEKLTSAIVKATRTETKIIYFVTNHGERGRENSEANGLTGLMDALKDNSFEVKSLDLIAQQGVPKDAAAVALVGPRAPLLDAEIDLLLKYAEEGGRLLIAADPGERHNVALLTKPLGVEYQNNYVLSPLAQIMGRSMASAIGLVYSDSSDITSKFSQNMTVFDLVSEVRAADGVGFDTNELVKTHNQSFVAPDLENIQATEQKAFPVAVSSQGQYKRVKADSAQADSAGAKSFSAV